MSRFSNSSTATEPPTRHPRSFEIASNLLPLRLVLQWGEARVGGLFLRETHTAHGEPESVGGRLNEPDTRFVPFSVHGSVELVRLGAVAYVEHLGELPEVVRLLETGAQSQEVAVELTTGEVIHGEILAHAPPERARLSDVLNQCEPFFPLLSQGSTLYVNRDAVAAVRGSADRPPREEAEPPQ